MFPKHYEKRFVKRGNLTEKISGQKIAAPGHKGKWLINVKSAPSNIEQELYSFNFFVTFANKTKEKK